MTNAAIIDASSARSKFAQLGARAKLAPLEITRHGKLEFVIISPELYARVKATNAAATNELDRMQVAFDALFEQMQSDRSNAAYDALAALSAEDLPATVAKAYKRIMKSRAAPSRSRVVG